MQFSGLTFRTTNSLDEAGQLPRSRLWLATSEWRVDQDNNCQIASANGLLPVGGPSDKIRKDLFL